MGVLYSPIARRQSAPWRSRVNEPGKWAALFDLDGLLIDSEPLWQQAEVTVFGRLGVPLTRQDCASTIGWRIDAVVAHWHRRHGWTGPSVTQVVEQIVAEVVRLVGTQGQALPGVSHALDVCRQAGLRLAVASSSRQVIIQAAVEALGVAAQFELLQSAQSEPFGKPHPGVFLQAAARLGTEPHHCIVFEDSPPGILAAKAAAMACVAVPSEHSVEPHTLAVADLVLPDLAALRVHHLQALMHPAVCQVRPARQQDWPAIDQVVRAAFAQPDEADLVRALRSEGSSTGEWVALAQGQVVGHVLYTRLVLAEAPELRLVALAPLSTDPAWQRRGVGDLLLRRSLTALRLTGVDGVVVLGDPQFYGRFGFTVQAASELHCPFAGPHLQALVWRAGQEPLAGTVRYAVPFLG